MLNAKRVLVVDDDTTIRTLIADALEDEAYEVTTANNGADALAKIDAVLPDAIVLDLMMPVMDGRAFLEACRQEAACAAIPVLVLSASHNLSTLAPELGARACLAKPFDLDVLLAIVDRLVETVDASPRVGLSHP